MRDWVMGVIFGVKKRGYRWEIFKGCIWYNLVVDWSDGCERELVNLLFWFFFFIFRFIRYLKFLVRGNGWKEKEEKG